VQCRLQVRQIFHLLEELCGDCISRVIEPMTPSSITYMYDIYFWLLLEEIEACIIKYKGSSRSVTTWKIKKMKGKCRLSGTALDITSS
jgi:hypothetical protein